MVGLLTNRRLWISAGLVAVLLAAALWPASTPVEVVAVSRGPLFVTVDEEGVTRVRDRFVLSVPVAGRVLRIELEPGDPVRRGQVVARVQPEAPPLLDARARAEAEAAVESARAALGRARAEEQRARAALAHAEREAERARTLAESSLVTPQEAEARAVDLQVARESVQAAAFAVRSASSEVARAEARLAPPASAPPGRVAAVTAPIDGVVLKRLRESEAVVPAGEPLLEVGEPHRLEIVADVLSTDAVRIAPGARAFVEQWGGNRRLAARVRRVEPSGFTKVSALGVEEQRVNVVLDFVDPVAAWAALGDGYRVEVRIVVWEGRDVLKVPTAALFRRGEEWAVYLADARRARQLAVTVGHQTGQEAEVLAGLAEGARVIIHPPAALTDGARLVEQPIR